MPAAIPIIAAVVGGGITAGTTIYATRQQRRMNRENRDASLEMNDEQMQLERERMAQEQAAWREEQDMLKAAHDAQVKRDEQEFAELRYQWDYDNALETPWRTGGLSAYNAVLQRAGLPTVDAPALPAAPAHFSSTPGTQPGSRDVLDAPTRNSTQMWDEPTAPTMRSDDTAMSPIAYARLATSPEALAEMTPEERVDFEQELASRPMSQLLTMPARRRSPRRTTYAAAV